MSDGTAVDVGLDQRSRMFQTRPSSVRFNFSSAWPVISRAAQGCLRLGIQVDGCMGSKNGLQVQGTVRLDSP
ncbi:hypothetical protein GGTG_03659 [Gaeumannomyces tritici R3-111a-1]|uniref:Uncharacterized protein n=1 Tax=Gaeumannomyces tritici (strain R3-111a-1) TaxID=644352 RepID=J3NQV3_GAET3|nr:hypothetical protein GGTG_03659 [Gaeumannomyces tritici R3-111a-1]EJT78559.1 hypothetical protein GGTG_03659 [Gaeumannomyces tritici R3-111a-1]